MKQSVPIEVAVGSGVDDRLSETVLREGKRLLAFIRSKVSDIEEAEDILQDVFYQLSATGIDSIEQVSSWLFTVARNRITDTYRKKKPEAFSKRNGQQNAEGPLTLAEILPDLSSDPEEIYLRRLILEELEDALTELPEAQREVFVLHEFEDKSFKEMSEEMGIPLNTLLSRKRYAVLHLRKRLEGLYKELISEEI
ncbi:MAG: RNA polymerase sigma factor [Bacteroidetes bacterium]|nr:MAG: RNA polymerase sigma factor [Bacteroidota bacterium]